MKYKCESCGRQAEQQESCCNAEMREQAEESSESSK
tara:strand:+ start:3512 stop:3619 length:108 start_codon:yes stop_codon:yes gene_type:complete